MSVAQVQIGGNVYGGGNRGEVQGSTKVTVKGGDLQMVFGGARMANVGGNSYVHIDGKEATGYILANKVFGGNDIAGTIGTAKAVDETLPTELLGNEDHVDDTWNSYVHISTKTEDDDTKFTQAEIDAATGNPDDPAYGKTTNDVKIHSVKETSDAQKIFLGQLFAGGNGDYIYEENGASYTEGEGATAVTMQKYDVYKEQKTGNQLIATVAVEKDKYKPELDKAYLDIQGGTIAFGYGGGNDATVREKTIIHVDNPSEVVTNILVNETTHIEADDANYTTYVKNIKDGLTDPIPSGFAELLTDDRIQNQMDIRMAQENIESSDFQIGRLFGGNNTAEMSIMPTWNLQRGMIRNLYSGGNRGNMTSRYGLLLEIDPKVSSHMSYDDSLIVKNKLKIDNVYGGCRMADVIPTGVNGGYVPVKNDSLNKVLQATYKFPDELAARVLLRGGNVRNVYGGNDVTGTVYGGNAVAIYTTVRGDVYGGGNGSYAYTDFYADDPTYGDYYFDEGSDLFTSLNAFRPNAEQVSIRLRGHDGRHPTVINGSVYLGGNCATISTEKEDPLVELKFGSYVIANNVFLGNNGEKMIDENVLKLYAGLQEGAEQYFSGSLTNTESFNKYMEGVVMRLQPSIVFDDVSKDPDNYLDFSSYVGSFYCGGNVGSMAIPGKSTYRISRGLNIFEKFVGGCNNANVPVLHPTIKDSNGDPVLDSDGNPTYNESIDLNAAYEGGILGTEDERIEDNDEFRFTSFYDVVDGKKLMQDRIELVLDNLGITPLRWDARDLIWNTNKWGYAYTPYPSGTELSAGTTYYTYSPTYTPHTTTAKYTVTESDFFYEKETENNQDTYTRIADGTELSAGTTYYTYTSNNYVANTVASGSTVTTDGTSTYCKKGEEEGFVAVPNSPLDADVRLLNGNIYGGCYNSGHVNGNVVININEDLLKKDEVFGNGMGPFNRKASGVDFLSQRDDLNALAMTVFGAGYGLDTEIWGSTTVNLNKGYTLQIFGGGEEGIVGKSTGTVADDATYVDGAYDEETGEYITNYKTYKYHPAYSTTVNLNGNVTVNMGAGITEQESSEGKVANLAEAEYLYGGGNEGDVCGNTRVNLGRGRVYDVFGGASNADILGHTEVYVGQQPDQLNGGYEAGFPWVRDIIYGGNDFGGTIRAGVYEVKKGNTYEKVLNGYDDDFDFTARIHNWADDKSKLHGYDSKTPNAIPDILKSSTYVEYLRGRVDTIFGGSYGYYDYKNLADADIPAQKSSFVNFRPVDNGNNKVNAVFGAGTGFPGYRNGDNSQERSYVLIDIPKDAKGNEVDNYLTTEFFGAGSYNGLGMRFTTEDSFKDTFSPDQLSAILDLLRGKIGNVFGGSYNEGVTARTVVNVPKESTIWMYSSEDDYDDEEEQIKHLKRYGNIFGGAYGTHILPPCDVYDSNINYCSSDAVVNGSIFGGNNNERRTLYTHVNIHSPVWAHHEKAAKGKLGIVYGAGQGKDTWSEYTEVNLQDSARVYEVYGGGMLGHVLNSESVQAYMNLYKDGPSNEISAKDPFWSNQFDEDGVKKWEIDPDTQMREVTDKYKDRWAADWADAWTLGSYYTPVKGVDSNEDGEIDSYTYDYTTYASNKSTNLSNPAENPSIVRTAKMDDRVYTDNAEKAKRQYKYNTNVIINSGATVAGYAYGGGYGKSDNPLSGDVYGTTYIALLGGTVSKDIYAAGTAGSIRDLFMVGQYDASSNPNGFTASSNAYIEGGTVRNVYGGGWKGHIGNHTKIVDGETVAADISDDPSGDILGETHVVIGKEVSDSSLVAGIPAIQRNVYAGGEGGSVYGKAHMKIYNGFVGYLYENASGTTYKYFKDHYVPNLDQDEAGDKKLKGHGNAFGGGYVADSYVDQSNIVMYGGTLRGSLYGGGELGPIGRGTKLTVSSSSLPSYAIQNDEATIYLPGEPGETSVTMYGGHVQRNVFGGGRGKDSWGNFGWKSDDVADLSAKGCVFGQTSVYIYGGKVGTKEGAVSGDGNVFGGGDEGYVYSAIGKRATATSGNVTEGYYYDRGTMTNLTEGCKVILSPYCRVTNADGVSINNTPYEKGDYVPTSALNTLTNGSTQWASLDQTGIEIANAVFAGGNISPGSDLTYANTTTVFGNATASVTDVFAKDLVTIGEDGIGGLYGDGNMTFVDGYRELNITNYGTDYYNLSQELSLDDYKKLTDRERAYFELLYKAKRQRDLRYYESKGTHSVTINEVQYNFKRGQKIPAYKEGSTTEDSDEWALIKSAGEEEKKNWEGDPYHSGSPKAKTYNTGDRITQDDYDLLWSAERDDPENWELYGFCTLYAGRMINTIQRADFCGVFGSRVVMRGAQDRVPKKVDYTEYTINRVKEVSLNQVEKNSINHGNYFGIYNVVHYLGALTSDVKFTDIRTTTNTEDAYKPNSATETYYDWKQKNLGNRKRNNGSSANEVALASGVWLELLDEKTEEQKEKVYGPITGIVELTLINVAPGEGGGYVYAKNEHGVRHESSNHQITLAAANTDARSWKQYYYDDPLTPTAGAALDPPVDPHMQMSGNFINPLKRIVDDCYPQSGAYYDQGQDKKAAPAHYWYIRGDYYVYDQYISAYTGSAQAYAEDVSIPLTITAESQGKLTLMNIKPNYYAYWNDISDVPEQYRSQIDPNAIVVGGTTYKLNDPINYWAFTHLTDTEKRYFTAQTWVCSNDAQYGGTTYKKGDVYNTQPTELYVCKEDINDVGESTTYTYNKGTTLTKAQYDVLSKDSKNKCAAAFNISNAISHDNGFLLTFDWDNPDIWSDYYHHETNDETVHASAYNSIPAGYVTSPSFKYSVSQTGNGTTVLGQIEYPQGSIIDKNTYDRQTAVADYVDSSKKQATFDEVYIVTAKENITTVDNVQYVPGACIPKGKEDGSEPGTYNSLSAADKANFSLGMLCTSTYEYTLADDDKSQYVVAGTTIPQGKADGSEPGTYNYLVKLANKENLNEFFSPGYICTEGGLWGGTKFTNNQHYPAIDYCNLSKDERTNFKYNYDALDLLVDPAYSGTDGLNNTTRDMTMYDKYGGPYTYSDPQSIDYEATYLGTTPITLTHAITVKYYDTDTQTIKPKENVTEIVNGYILTNTDYEALTNEAVNYTPIVVTSTHPTDTTYYVVKNGFQIGDKWYSAGNQMTYAIWDGLSATDKQNVAEVKYTDLVGSATISESRNYYFCTNPYIAITPLVPINHDPYAEGATVEVGTIINYEETGSNKGYKDLKNDQRNFSIEGKTPTETSTLYVSREVDINDLSEDKVVTAIYYYDYVESDESGSAYEKIREYHVVNVHIHFESGQPTIGELLPPDIVLPGDPVSLNQPSVSKGAYEILGGGWEIFPDAKSAETHKNGQEFSYGTTPLYWYQDGRLVAYYALTYLGKTYSNAVPLAVANYHRMNDVLNIGENNAVTTDNHYMYLNDAVEAEKRDPKVYIRNDNELNKFAAFFNKTQTDSELSAVKNAQHIDFIVDGDISHEGTWASVGGSGTQADQCANSFQGTLHGDGHTISGLDHSLFGTLCGDVYNLGVTGPFTTAGIADTGTGYVENCWAKTSATSGFATGDNAVYAVFGNPTAENDNVKQIVNSYYNSPAGAYKTGASTHGVATLKSEAAFYNGEVAYDLNGFYLYKRYNDQKTTTGSTASQYKYYKAGVTDTETGHLIPQDAYYASNEQYCSSGYVDKDSKVIKYVEERYADGDFRYAGGTIPNTPDERRYVVNELTGEEAFYPIWPDDYLYFGQKLNYGYGTLAHQEVPMAVVKDGGRLSSEANANRVFRAPAYYRESTMGVAHFNPNAYLAQKEKLTTEQIEANVTAREAYPHMTAIDFAGHGEGHDASAYKLGSQGSWFYQPLLDDDGLTGIQNCDETQNLLVYAPAEESDNGYANKATHDVLNSMNSDLAFSGYYDYANGYRLVGDATLETVNYHLVQHDLRATNDHMLVDRQDFNAPFAYDFTGGHRMWYQRKPDSYVDRSTGWEGISLPFTAELVTTHQKGEITHFYDGSYDYLDDRNGPQKGGDSKVGHEYWLRTFTGIEEKQVTENNVTVTKAIANFTYPTSSDGSVTMNKTGLNKVENTFLWDYYYEKADRKDAHADTYQEYYSEAREYSTYPLVTAATPYLIGFPGSTYYEFDLSGTFIPKNTATAIANLNAQVITFASAANTSIGVSDSEKAGVSYTYENKSPNTHGNDKAYTFKPSYLNMTFEAGADNYTMATDGGSYDKVQAKPVQVAAFRPYFAGPTALARPTRSILFANLSPEDQWPQHPQSAQEPGTLSARSGRHVIAVSSSLKAVVPVRIVNTAGQTIATFDIEPGETVETRVNISGVYVVQSTDARFTKKLSVR